MKTALYYIMHALALGAFLATCFMVLIGLSVLTPQEPTKAEIILALWEPDHE